MPIAIAFADDDELWPIAVSKGLHQLEKVAVGKFGRTRFRRRWQRADGVVEVAPLAQRLGNADVFCPRCRGKRLLFQEAGKGFIGRIFLPVLEVFERGSAFFRSLYAQRREVVFYLHFV